MVMVGKPLRRWIAGILIPCMIFNAVVVPTALSANDSNSGFGLEDLFISGLEGMFDRSCGGYCIVGACAHLVIRVTMSGIKIYTIVSPKIRHASADLVVSSYDHIGAEPWREWRTVVGSAMNTINKNLVSGILRIPDGLRGTQQQYQEFGKHQAVVFKEVDIVGHPAALIPRIATKNGIKLSSLYTSFKLPSVGSLTPDNPPTPTNPTSGTDWSLSSMLSAGFKAISEAFITIIMETLHTLLEALDFIQMIMDMVELFDTITDLLEFYNNAMTLIEATVRGSIWGNLVNPRFRADRLFCPTAIQPFQPYYLSYLDPLFWRTGFPVTDGPLSHSDHSFSILNPISSDRLGPPGEIWGHLYPREGAINQHNDPKAASVLAVRAVDVLEKDIGPDGYRIGVELPRSTKEWSSIWNFWQDPEDDPDAPPSWLSYLTTHQIRYTSGRWQMIHPVKRSCSATPFYPSGLTQDFMKENRSYAWNYYHIYSCCMNTRGTKILEISIPPLCLNLL